MAVEDQVREIRARVERLQQQRVRAEVERDQASAAVESIRERLRDDFGVETPEDGQRVLAELEAELARSVGEVQAALGRTT